MPLAATYTFQHASLCSHIVSVLKRAKVWTTQPNPPAHAYDIDFTTRQHECLSGGAAALWYHAVRPDGPFYFHWNQVRSMQLKHDNRCPHTLHYSNLQTLKPICFAFNFYFAKWRGYCVCGLRHLLFLQQSWQQISFVFCFVSVKSCVVLYTSKC